MIGSVSFPLERRVEALRADRSRWRQRFSHAEGALLDFGSNDYLGLGQSEAFAEHWRNLDARPGAGASSLLSGFRPEIERLEKRLARFVGRDRALVFSSGYAANLGLLSALALASDVIVMDKYCHASMIDGARLSAGKLRRFPHLDYEGLERQLERHRTQPAIVCTETVFSMEGDCVDTQRVLELAGRHGALVVFDEAHALGVFGPQGAGLSYGLDGDIAVVGTLGKSFGCAGGFVAGSAMLIDYLLQRARSVIYSTAISPALCAAASAALDLVRSADDLRARLRERITYFERSAHSRNLPLRSHGTPIASLMLHDEDAALRLSAMLRDQGIYVPAIRPPTVPNGTSRLRVSIKASHQAADIDRLLDAIAAAA